MKFLVLVLGLAVGLAACANANSDYGRWITTIDLHNPPMKKVRLRPGGQRTAPPTEQAESSEPDGSSAASAASAPSASAPAPSTGGGGGVTFGPGNGFSRDGSAGGLVSCPTC